MSTPGAVWVQSGAPIEELGPATRVEVPGCFALRWTADDAATRA